jgi:ABC-type transport system substrate-binding protein
LLVALLAAAPASAQKEGGILKMYTVDSPASMSILEEATVFAERPMMGVFNNLVMYDQHVKQNSLQSIVPDLATSWSWNEDGTELTFPLRQGVSWHDGKPFTAKDVVCTLDLLTGNSNEKLRVDRQELIGTRLSILVPVTGTPVLPKARSSRSRWPRRRNAGDRTSRGRWPEKSSFTGASGRRACRLPSPRS